MSVLAYQDVHYRYSETAPGSPNIAISGITLNVTPGECLLLLGKNGSGKSTLIRLANGLIPHFYPGDFGGTVLVGGRDTRRYKVRSLADVVGIVFQNHEAQLCSPTVGRDLAFGPCNLQLPRAEVANRVAWAAAATGCDHLLDRSISRLSGGERARVAIAGVLAMAPPLLILDEPTVSLDPVAAADCWAILARLHKQGTAIVVAEHQPNQGWAVASQVASLIAGQLAFTEPIADVVRSTEHAAQLPLPILTRLFVDAGIPDRPLTLADAVTAIRYHGLSLSNTAAHRSSPGETLLVGRDLHVSRDGKSVLRGVDLELRRGETVALLGPNGVGKTTLLRLLAGLARSDNGVVSDVVGRPLPPAKIGLLLQGSSDALFCRTVREEVEYSARHLGRHDPAWLDWLISHFALGDILDRPPLALSAGQQRRVALAATLSHRPAIILLDEPTIGLDHEQRDALEAILADLRANSVATLIATHDLEFAARRCDRWIVLADGTTIADAPPATILENPAILARARLLPTSLAALAQALDVPYPGEEARLSTPEFPRP